MSLLRTASNAVRRLRARLGWDRLWGNPSYAPEWFIDGPRHPVRQAVAEGWLERGSTVLELGCGKGQQTAWLAREGFEVVGVDISHYAIEAAQQDYGAVPSLSFRVLDVTVPTSLPAFDAIVDAGCLHCIPPPLLEECAANLRRWSRPGTRLLVMMHTATTSSAERMRQVERLLTPAFTVIDARESIDPARADGHRPRMVFRLIRCDEIETGDRPPLRASSRPA